MWSLAVLMGDRINGFFFFWRKCVAVFLGRNNEVTILPRLSLGRVPLYSLIYDSKFSLTSFPWQVLLGSVNGKIWQVIILVLVQGHLSWKSFPRPIFASVNYLSSALVKENLSYFPITLPRKTCQGKTCQGKTCQGELASVNEAWTDSLCSASQMYNCK